MRGSKFLVNRTELTYFNINPFQRLKLYGSGLPFVFKALVVEDKCIVRTTYTEGQSLELLNICFAVPIFEAPKYLEVCCYVIE